jgi:polyphosphate kinase
LIYFLGKEQKMSKHDKKDKEKKKKSKEARTQVETGTVEASAEHQPEVVGSSESEETKPKISDKEFEKLMLPLQVELVKLQEWVKFSGAKICVIFEGRDTAGKGGTIKRIVERVSPRVFKVMALSAPTPREKSQMYFQRYMPLLPAAGEVVIFDRSWYNRAGVERVMGFASEEQVQYFLKFVAPVENSIIHSGVILIKYWLEVSMEEQRRRFEARDQDARKIWKLSPMDMEAQSRWYDYSRARDEMFACTDTPDSPWYVVPSDDKKRARLNLISHFLSLIPYEEVPREPVKFPKPQKKGDYQEPNYPYRFVPQKY